MMNNKGFTLIELLTVIALIAILALIAVPNMIGISDDVKKEQMINDAKRYISLAKNKVNIDYDIRNSSEHIFYISELDKNGDIKNDPDSGIYNILSYVKYYKISGNVKYCVYLIGSKRFLSDEEGNDKSPSCVDEEKLYSKDIVVYGNE